MFFSFLCSPMHLPFFVLFPIQLTNWNFKQWIPINPAQRMTNLIPVKNKQALERIIIFHSVHSNQIRSGAHKPQRGEDSEPCVCGVLSHQFKQAERWTVSNFNKRLINISTLVACQSSPTLTTQTHSKLYTHKPQAAAIHNAHPEAVAVEGTFNANLSESKKKKQTTRKIHHQFSVLFTWKQIKVSSWQ